MTIFLVWKSCCGGMLTGLTKKSLDDSESLSL